MAGKRLPTVLSACPQCGAVRRLSQKLAGCHCVRCARLKRKNITHGLSAHRINKIWHGMMDRCGHTGASSPRFYLYGARGIHVCDEWREDKTRFFAWAFANGYTADLSIDRIDNDKGYEPSNCRWATMLEQARNHRPRTVGTKLTIETVRVIKQRALAGEGLRALGREYGVSGNVVRFIKLGRIWKAA